MARTWYVYNGIGDPLVPASYISTFSKPSCASGCSLCAIYATGTGINPSVLSSNIRGYIGDVLATQISQPGGINTGIKKYAYGKIGC